MRPESLRTRARAPADTASANSATAQGQRPAKNTANTATASGKDPSGKDVTGRGSTIVPGPVPAPSLHIAKSASPTVFGAVGEPIRFTVVTTNNGNVTAGSSTSGGVGGN